MFLSNQDVFSIMLQYLMPYGEDVIHVKLVSSACKDMVEKAVPMHHIISIFLAMAKNELHIPSLEVSSDFIIDSYRFHLFIVQWRTNHQEHEHVAEHLVTKFILQFHNHPITIQCFLLAHNYTFLLQLAKDNYFPESPTFQRLREMKYLACIIQGSEVVFEKYAVNESWVKEKGWGAVFFTPVSVYDTICPIGISLPNDKELMDGIIENKELLLFLVIKCYESTQINLVNHLLSHWKWKEYKLDVRMQTILLVRVSDEFLEKRLATELSLATCRDVKFLDTLLKRKGRLFNYLSPTMMDNKTLLMTALSTFHVAYTYAEVGTQFDKDIVKILCRGRRYSAEELEPTINFFWHEEEFLKELVLLKPSLSIPVDWLQHNREEALKAVTKNRLIFSERLHEHWSNDREIVLAAVKSDGSALEFVSDELKNDEEVVLTALLNNPSAIQFATSFEQNRDVLLKVLKYKGYALRFFDKKFLNDFEIILEAVKTNSFSFARASAEIRQDYSCIKQVLRMNGECFVYLSEELQEDEELIHIALQSDPMVLKCLPKEIQEKKETIQVTKQVYGVQ